jgi:hypothetical protein
LYGAWPVYFLVNASLEAEPDPYQPSHLSLPIHTSANASPVGGRVDLDCYIVFWYIKLWEIYQNWAMSQIAWPVLTMTSPPCHCRQRPPILGCCQNSSSGTATGYGLGGQGSISGRGKIFLFSIAYRPTLGPTELPLQWVPGAPPRG